MRTGPGGDFLAVPAETGHGAAVAHEDPRPLRGPPARPGPRERTAWRERCVSGARPPRVASVLRGAASPPSGGRTALRFLEERLPASAPELRASAC